MKWPFLYLLCVLSICESRAQILAYNNTNTSPDFGFFSFEPSVEMGLQDYVIDTTLLQSDTCRIVSMNFVGGLDSAGQMRLQFLRTDTSLISSWLFTLSAGYFNYNLAFDSLVIPEKGIIRVRSVEATGGKWFLNAPNFQIGSQDTIGAAEVDGLKLVHALGISCAGVNEECPPFLNLNNALISSGTYAASRGIACIGNIPTSNAVNLLAAEEIRYSNFTVTLGGTLEVFVKNCAQGE